MDRDPSRRPRGRPRDPGIDERILEAALGRLAEEGFSRMSVDGVAADAGVPKATIYRRWSSKEDLATAALRRLQSREPRPREGSTRDELVDVLRAFRRSLLRPSGMAMIGTLLAEEVHNPELLALFRERIVTPRRGRLRAALERGVERGEIRRDADLDAAVNLMVGSFYARYLAESRVPRDWPARVVALVWPGVARP